MKKLIPGIFLLFCLLSCERSTYDIGSYLSARIVGFDLNCATCILEFPEDSSEVMKEIGESQDNLYQSINLNKGNYQIGQKIKVKIRNPETGELKECITLNQSNIYKDVFVTDIENYDNLIFNDTLYLAHGDCLDNPEDQWYICFDSVVNDSRCPIGVECFWEGNAKVRFKFEKYNSLPVCFNLNTYRGFTNDTIIDSYKFTLLGLSPYPSANQGTKQKDIKAELLIEKK